MARSTILDEVMNDPLASGGFVWRYGLVYGHYSHKFKDMAFVSLLIGTMARHSIHGLPDTRVLSASEQAEMWEAAGTGDIDTLSRLVGKIRENEPCDR